MDTKQDGNIKMREKSFVILTCIPCFTLIFFAVKFSNDLLLLIALVFTAVFAFLSGLIYDYFILDSQSTSFLYAGCEALKRGYDPKSQNGIYCNPEKYTISEVNKVEFYMYNSNDTCFLYWQFFFDVYETRRDFLKEQKMLLSKIAKNKVFVALEPK